MAGRQISQSRSKTTNESQNNRKREYPEDFFNRHRSQDQEKLVKSTIDRKIVENATGAGEVENTRNQRVSKMVNSQDVKRYGAKVQKISTTQRIGRQENV